MKKKPPDRRLVSALVELPDGRVVRRHQDHMWRSYSQDPAKSNPEIYVPGVVLDADCTTDATQPNREFV